MGLWKAILGLIEVTQGLRDTREPMEVNWRLREVTRGLRKVIWENKEVIGGHIVFGGLREVNLGLRKVN